MCIVRRDIRILNLSECPWGWNPEEFALVFSSAAEMKDIWRGRAGFMPPLQVSSTLSLNVISKYNTLSFFMLCCYRREGRAFSISLLCLALTSLSTWSHGVSSPVQCPFRVETTDRRRLGEWVRDKGRSARITLEEVRGAWEATPWQLEFS